jgi:hypothetical protein
MKFKVVLVSILLTFIITACSGQSNGGDTKEKHSNHQQHASNDIREETGSLSETPDFLRDKPENIQLIYLAAAQNKELLENIPCYCGCGESVNHKNNYDCFVYENKENGAVVWDDHGTKCGVCLEIAAQSVLDYQEGKSIKDIRSKIDSMYKDGYAKPTSTPEI